MQEEEVWKRMYLVLAGAVLDATEMLETTPQGIRAGVRLSEAMQEAEEIYLSAGETPCGKT